MQYYNKCPECSHIELEECGCNMENLGLICCACGIRNDYDSWHHIYDKMNIIVDSLPEGAFVHHVNHHGGL